MGCIDWARHASSCSQRHQLYSCSFVAPARPPKPTQRLSTGAPWLWRERSRSRYPRPLRQSTRLRLRRPQREVVNMEFSPAQLEALMAAFDLEVSQSTAALAKEPTPAGRPYNTRDSSAFSAWYAPPEQRLELEPEPEPEQRVDLPLAAPELEPEPVSIFDKLANSNQESGGRRSPRWPRARSPAQRRAHDDHVARMRHRHRPTSPARRAPLEDSDAFVSDMLAENAHPGTQSLSLSSSPRGKNIWRPAGGPTPTSPNQTRPDYYRPPIEPDDASSPEPNVVSEPGRIDQMIEEGFRRQERLAQIREVHCCSAYGHTRTHPFAC